MKKLKILTLALLCALITPVFAGCFGGGGPKLEIYVSPAIYYEVGQVINLDNAKLKYGENYVAITENMVSSFSTKTAGSKQMIITHDNKTLMLDYKVFENVQHNTWYEAKFDDHPILEGFGEGSSYIKFNKINNSVIIFSCNGSTDKESLDHYAEQHGRTLQYTQELNANGIKISTSLTYPDQNVLMTYEFTNITANSFTYVEKSYLNGVLMPEYSYTLSFTKM